MSLLDEHVVVFITGISAAGKSTVAEMLARRFERGVHVGGDGFRRMVVAGREEITASPTREVRVRRRRQHDPGSLSAAETVAEIISRGVAEGSEA